MFNKVIKILLVIGVFAFLIILNRIAENGRCPFIKNNPPPVGSTLSDSAKTGSSAKPV